jgi:hypothetical protein
MKIRIFKLTDGDGLDINFLAWHIHPQQATRIKNSPWVSPPLLADVSLALDSKS